MATCIVPMLVILSASAQDSQDGCVLKIEDKDVAVYSCKRENSEFNSIRAQFAIRTSLDRYVDIMLDVASYPEWHKEIQEPRIVERISETEIIYYASVDAPWPVSDRYMALRLKVEKDDLKRVVYLKHSIASEYMKEREGMMKNYPIFMVSGRKK